MSSQPSPAKTRGNLVDFNCQPSFGDKLPVSNLKALYVTKFFVPTL